MNQIKRSLSFVLSFLLTIVMFFSCEKEVIQDDSWKERYIVGQSFWVTNQTPDNDIFEGKWVFQEDGILKVYDVTGTLKWVIKYEFVNQPSIYSTSIKLDRQTLVREPYEYYLIDIVGGKDVALEAIYAQQETQQYFLENVEEQ